MIFWVIVSLLQEVLAVAGVGECNILCVFPQNDLFKLTHFLGILQQRLCVGCVFITRLNYKLKSIQFLSHCQQDQNQLHLNPYSNHF